MKGSHAIVQNLTLSLDRDTIRRAKVLAARRETSVSRLVADMLRRIVEDDDTYNAAMTESLAMLDHGFHLGGRIETTREELHDRQALR